MKCIRTLLPLVLAWPIGMPSASADDTASERGSALESIVVTAHRLPSRIPVLPVIAVDPTEQPLIGLQALRTLPTFAIGQSGSLGSLTQVRVRGADANHLLVLVDGIDVMDLTADSGFNFGNLNLAGISRIEYLPGAQSAVWGNQAAAGVLHLSTEPQGRVRSAAIETGAFASRQASLQLADSRADHFYNLSAVDFATDGTNVARQGDERDGHHNDAWLASAGLKRENWTLRTLARRIRTTADFDPTPFPAFLPVDGDRRNRHDETLTLASLDLFGTDTAWLQRFSVARFETANTTRTDDVRTASTDGRRWQFVSITGVPLGTRQELQFLVEHRRETFEQRGEASDFGDPNQRQRMASTSAGVEYLLAIAERWRFSASARHDSNSDFADSESVRLALNHDLGDDTRVWVAAGTGVKLPSFVERFGFTPDSFLGNADLEAERNRHVSAGVEHARGRWTHALTLYRDRLEDEINGFAFDPVRGGFTSVNESGESRREGAEWRSSAGWQGGALQVGASWLDAESGDGSRAIRRPRRQAFVTVDQLVGGVAVQAGAFHVGAQLDQDFSTWPATRVRLDDYTLVHAALTVPVGERVRLGLRGSNLLDETYEDILGYRAPGRAWYVNLGVDF